MALQYISDGEGKHTFVLIPISEWEVIISKYPALHEFAKPQSKKLSDSFNFAANIPKDISDEMQ